MAIEVKLPSIDENTPGGDVVNVKVAVGDAVSPGQALIEVEAGKATVDVAAETAGKVAKILVKKGEKVSTGQTLVVLEGANGQAETAPAAGAKPASAPPAAALAPAAQAPPAPPQASPPPAAPQAAAPQTDAAPKPAPAPAPKPAPAAAGPDAVVPAGPATRKLAREWNIPLEGVPGTGPFGRITQEDLKTHVGHLAAGGGSAGRGGVQVPPLPDFAKWGPVNVKPFESIRRRTAEHMALCWQTIPHVTQHDLADVTDIEAFRKQQESKGPKLTVTAFVLKACAIVLKQFPQFNSSLDEAGGRLIEKNYFHLGVAVDTEKGLVVPVLRDVDKKSVHEIGREMTEIAERARQGKLKPEDMQGGTFTISNLGGIGGTAFTPIVNWPQVAILGLSRSKLGPVFKEGQFVPRLGMPLSLSYDHRVIDGADAARFARRIAELLENPMVMLLHA